MVLLVLSSGFVETLAAYRYIATWMSAKEVKDRVSMDDKDGFNVDWT